MLNPAASLSKSAGDWSPSSWRSKPAAQQPNYPSDEKLQIALRALGELPPLVTSWEIEALKGQLAEAAAGRRFLLQGGDCAESFVDCTGAAVVNRIKILLQMSLVLVHGSEKPVIRVGRFAGQYAKPRSSDNETRDGATLPAYRGDLVNRKAFDESSRIPDPELMLRAYERAALTLNYTRALVRGGLADLHHPENWNIGFIQKAELATEYSQILDSVSHALRFMENVLGVHAEAMQRVDLFTSHEGLHLPYEEAITRQENDRWYNLSTHFPWIGARTTSPDGAHVEFFRGLANPIGMKVAEPESCLRVLDILDPDWEPGRVTLIHRFGAEKIQERLPKLIRAVKGSGRQVLWCCDPMHGNTKTTSTGIKTRHFGDILSELESSFDVHASEGTYLGGVHLELSGDDVTECIGGASGITEQDLARAYKSDVDPRLNYEQALEVAMLIAHRLRSV
ncbi:MAG TPA: 3-deoxy-7-phosphoheptulonate synthase class II [Bryobacteraceae bacterium]|nr:3-deoxy-7-phosphoheptulonate synthase class II [Bryobacteraceae bacterium]